MSFLQSEEAQLRQTLHGLGQIEPVEVTNCTPPTTRGELACTRRPSRGRRVPMKSSWTAASLQTSS